MTTAELSFMRTHLIRMICDESNERVLHEIEMLLSAGNISIEDVPCRYTAKELKLRVRQATAAIRAGQGYTIEEMRSKHPRRV